MGKTKREAGSTAELSFHKHYSAIWGGDRWYTSLYPSLAERTRYATLVNRLCPLSAFNACMTLVHQVEDLDGIVFPTARSRDGRAYSKLLCFVRKLEESALNDEGVSSGKTVLMPAPSMFKSPGATVNLMTHWNLDAASILAVHLLDVQPGDNVLDLCAAPGGKSIAIAQSLWPQLHQEDLTGRSPTTRPSLGSLCSNESDASRFKRLSENLKAYIPAHLFASKQVTTMQIDGTDPLAARKLSIGSRGYDKVLVDAPCSSERHIIHAQAKLAGQLPPEMANWRPGSSKRLAKTQTELLITGLRAVKVGGNVLYATCSIEMSENDGVVEKVLAQVEKEVKKGAKWRVTVGLNGGADDEHLESELEDKWAERTKYGWIVLPDHPAGGKWGPLFFTMFTKVDVTC